MNIFPEGFFPFVLIGLVVGWIIGMLFKDGGYSRLGDLLLGIVGAVIGGFLVGLILGIHQNMFATISITSILLALFGSVITVTIVRLVTRSIHLRRRTE